MNKSFKIEELRNGAALEMLNREIQKVADDIADPNKQTKAKRKVSLTLEFAPNEDGRMGSLAISVTSSLAKQNPAMASLFFGFENGKGIASENVIPSLPLAEIEAEGESN